MKNIFTIQIGHFRVKSRPMRFMPFSVHKSKSTGFDSSSSDWSSSEDEYGPPRKPTWNSACPDPEDRHWRSISRHSTGWFWIYSTDPSVVPRRGI